jgi:hypothetical protein
LQPGQYIYENGPINGTVSKWEINGGFAVSDSFVVDTAGAITGLNFGAWLSPGDVLLSVEVSITSSEFGGTSFFDQTVSFTQSGCEGNGLGFNVCTESGTFSGPSLNAGTYWLNVSNATNNGHPIYWDENSGVDCHSTDCPSLASENAVGTIPSESFTLSGTPANQTTTTLTVTPDPASAGQVVALAATVLDQGQHPVTVGTVSFFNGSQLLGTVQSFDSPPTTALLQTRFGPGAYSITAQYNTNAIYPGSVSAAQPLTVTGTEPTVSTLTATPDNGGYDFNLSVFGYGFAALGGSASLNNLTQGGLGIGTINVPGPGTAMFLAQQTYGSGPAPAGIAVGDFNGDGITDLVVASYKAGIGNTFSLLLGNADGSFQPPINTTIGSSSVGIAVGDFNGDGLADVAVADSGQNAVVVRLGNGDGTFQPERINDTGIGPAGIVVADFNGDGNADLAVTNYDIGHGNTVTILLGDGLSNFTQLPALTTGSGPYGIVAADFNSDGLPDLAVVNENDDTISVLINLGNGGFQQQRTYRVGHGPVGIAAGDFEGNGNVDLAVTNYGNGSNNTVSILIGNGDGTFQAEQEYTTGTGPYGIAVGVFNPSGIADLVTADQTGNTVTVIPGNGDGTFGAPHSYPAGNTPLFVVAADFNGDGGPDIAVSNYNSGSGNTVSTFLGGTISTGQLNDIPVYGVGQQNVQSNFAPGGSFYAGSLSNMVPLQGEGLPTTTTLTGGPSPSSYLQPLTFTATITVPPGSGTPTGTVTYSYDQTPITGCVGLALQNGNVPPCQTATIPVGTHCIAAAYSGDNTFAPSQSSCFTQTVNRAAGNVAAISAPNPSQYNQTVMITAVVSGQFGGSPTGTVDFRDGQTLLCGGVQLNNMETAVCQVQNLSGGTHSQITACYSGDANFQPGCGQDMQVVNKASVTVTVSSATNPSQFGQPVTITAVVHGAPAGASPSGTVTFMDTLNGVQTTLCSALPVNQACSTTILAVGTHSQIVASYGGDQNYLAGNGTDSPPQVVLAPVGDFTILPISPGTVEVTQTFTNNDDPFHSQPINVTVQPLSDYNGTVRLSCSVSPPLTGGTCTVNSPVSGSLATGNLNTTLTIGVGGTTPTGNYTVTVLAQDDSGLMHNATLALAVDEKTTGLTMTTGGTGPPVPVVFGPGPGAVNNFSCSLVSGTGITGTEDFGLIGGVCSFNQTTANLPDPVVVTISGCTIARLGTGTRIYASLWFGLPGVVLLGSFRRRPRPGKKLLRLFVLFLAVLILLIGMGCGGVGQTTPTGSYLVLVQGTGADGTVYSAVIPVTVKPLGQ